MSTRKKAEEIMSEAGVPPGEPGRGKGPSQSSILVKIAKERFALFMSDDGRPYAVKIDGPNVALQLRGKAGLRSTLAKIYVDEQNGAVPSQSALADAMTVLEGEAQSAEPRVPQLRVARDDDGRIVVDLGTMDGRCIIVGPDGWERAPKSPVLFRRSGAMKALPVPTRIGDGLAKLANLLNIDGDGFRLLVAWLIAAFIPDLPHPILAFRGEQGTGKSKSAQMVIGIIDPSGAPKRTAPRDVKSWATQAFNSWGLCLDNVSTVPDWLSDALCRAVTGDGIVDRALYTDDDVVVLEFRRVLALTTIDAGALAGDLAERLLTLELNLIPDHKRREETDLDQAYGDAHAAILASLFDLLTEVLRVLPDVTLTERPRMADFARILAAVDLVKGWKTLDTYTTGARHAVADVLDGDPFALAVVELVDRAGEAGIKHTAQQLLNELAPEGKKALPVGWPKGAAATGTRLKRLAPSLRSIGIGFEEMRSKKGRFYALTATARRRQEQKAEEPRERRCETPSSLAPNLVKSAMTSRNRGDSDYTPSLSPLATDPGSGESDDGTLSPVETGSDQWKRSMGDSGDGDDGVSHLLSRDHVSTPERDLCRGCGEPMTIVTPGQTCHPDDTCEAMASATAGKANR